MLVYTLVGLAVGIVGTLLVLRYKDADMANGKKALVLALWAVGLILIGFSCDWGYAAVAEGEPQSMAMGFLVFGGIGLIFAIVAFRLGMAKKAAEPKEALEAEDA